MRRALALLPALALFAAGCGSSPAPPASPPAPRVLPPAVGAPTSPAPTVAPAGFTVKVGASPEAVVADAGTHGFGVAVRTPSRLVVVDGRSGALLPGVTVRGSGPPSVFPVTTEGGGTGVLAIAPGGGPVPSAFAGGRVFVALPGTAAVAVLDGGRRTARLALPEPPSALAAADAGRLLAAVLPRRHVVALYDPRTLRSVGSAPAGTGPARLAAEQGRLYVTDPRGGALLVFSVRPELKLLRHVALAGGPYAVASDPVHHRVWVTLPARNRLVELATADPARVLRRLPTVRQPDAVAVDPGTLTVAVAGRRGDVLQLIRGPG